MRQIVSYDGAEDIEYVVESLKKRPFQTLEELRNFMDEGDKVFKVTMTIEEIKNEH